MSLRQLKKLGIPFFIAVMGIFFSFYVHYKLEMEIQSAKQLEMVESYYPYVVLVVGICISFLIATIIYITQLTRERTLVLNQINEDLKKEIAERIHAEETKRRLEIALLQGQKLQAIGTLAGGIAHDFNNILYAIVGYVELAQDTVPKDGQTYKNLGKVLDGTRRGQELISRILAFSRRQHHDFEIINIQKTIEAALSLLRPTIPASVIIHFEPKPAVANIQTLGNQTQLHQVLVNIINNAVDAMEGEGTITITMQSLLADDPYLRRFPEIKSQNYCRISIEDTGHGMDQRTMDRIYEPFFTTKEVGKGTGLGMSIVHSIIKEHQGEITLTSQLGHGTIFTILLPQN